MQISADTSNATNFTSLMGCHSSRQKDSPQKSKAISEQTVQETERMWQSKEEGEQKADLTWSQSLAGAG